MECLCSSISPYLCTASASSRLPLISTATSDWGSWWPSHRTHFQDGLYYSHLCWACTLPTSSAEWGPSHTCGEAAGHHFFVLLCQNPWTGQVGRGKRELRALQIPLFLCGAQQVLNHRHFLHCYMPCGFAQRETVAVAKFYSLVVALWWEDWLHLSQSHS